MLLVGLMSLFKSLHNFTYIEALQWNYLVKTLIILRFFKFDSKQDFFAICLLKFAQRYFYYVLQGFEWEPYIFGLF